MRRPSARLLAALLALALVGAACSSRDDDDSGTAANGGGNGGDDGSGAIPIDDCASDPTAEIEGDTITLVSSYPQSGVTAAFAEIARGWRSYFEMVNDEGGVTVGDRTFTIETKDKDDEYNAAKTNANIQELVGANGDKAFAVFSVVGTANNIAVRDLLDDLCVPDVFAATGSPAWGNPEYPWLIGSTLAPYTLEGQMFARLLQEEQPDAKVAMLVQNDDFGEAYEAGFRQAIEGTDIEVVKVERYQGGVTADVGTQLTSLAATKADAFFNGATLLACPDALTKAKQANWEPITWVSGTCISKTLMGIAGEAADGVYSASNIKDPLDPMWNDDEAMQLYEETVAKYQPEADLDNGIVAYGWTQAALFIDALEAAEAPTRLAVMESIRNLEVSDSGLLLPGVTVKTEAPGDEFMGEALQLVQYDFAQLHFKLVGDLVDFEGETAELTPEALVTG